MQNGRTIPDLLVGIGLGILTSLVAWWILARAITPKLVLDREIAKRADLTGKAPWRYSIRIANKRRWWLPHSPAIDVYVSVRLRIKGLRDPDLWTLFIVPTGDTGHADIVEVARHFRLRIYDIDRDQGDFRLLPGDVRAGIADGDVQLEELLKLGTRAELRVMVSGSHSYTLGRAARFARYALDDIQVPSLDAADSPSPAPVG